MDYTPPVSRKELGQAVSRMTNGQAVSRMTNGQFPDHQRRYDAFKAVLSEVLGVEIPYGEVYATFLGHRGDLSDEQASQIMVAATLLSEPVDK